MWSSEEELDFEQASDNASKLVLLGSAQKAGIFEALTKENDIASLSKALGADERALYIALEALCSLEYVNKKDNLYIIADKARPLFLERSDEYVGDFLPHFLNIMRAWIALPEIIKGAKPVREPAKYDVAVFVKAMSSRPDTIVEEAVDRCLERKRDARKLLDLGGGPGKYSKVFIDRGLTAVLYDMPEVIAYVSSEFGLKKIKNLTLVKGDFTTDEFGIEFNETFDIVSMGNVCHIYSEKTNRKIIKHVRELLNPGGMIAIEDFVRGRSPKAEMFAVNMLANSEEGNTWSEAQYRDWLDEAGFKATEVVDLVKKGKQLITAFKE